MSTENGLPIGGTTPENGKGNSPLGEEDKPQNIYYPGLPSDIPSVEIPVPILKQVKQFLEAIQSPSVIFTGNSVQMATSAFELARENSSRCYEILRPLLEAAEIEDVYPKR